MTQPADARDANYVLTLEEIGNLAEERQAGRDADECGRADRRALQDRCLLRLSAGAGPRQSGAGGDAWVCARECIGTLRMALHEGLAGLVAEQVRPVAVEQVASHPRFKYFSEAGEDAYQSFLGVPLIDRGVLQGVLVVQTVADRELFRTTKSAC